MSDPNTGYISQHSERQRTLTERGTTFYEDNLQKLNTTVSRVWREIEIALFDYESKSSDLSPKALNRYQEEVTTLRDKFIEVSDSVVDFLVRTNTAESLVEKEKHFDVYLKRKDIVDRFLQNLEERILDLADIISQKLASSTKTSSTRSTSRHSASTIILQKRINVESQRTRLRYLKHEINLAKQKSQLELDLRLLKQERETAVAEAEAEAARKHGELRESLVKEEFQPPIPKEEIVSRYMASIEGNPSESFVNLPPPMFHSTPNEQPPPVNEPPQRNVVGDLTSFLLKKDLLTSRFMTFSDQPEAFAAWKTSFQGIIWELHATPGEELDLLIKWLGPESRKFATSMRTANPRDPRKAVRLIWQRLRERYGSPELVEAALKTKLDKFPSLTLSDNKKLYELADLLAEIASVKEDPLYKNLLSYFDSSSGIMPIIRKLPYNIQDKWITRASVYKRQTGLSYPPFKFLVEFVLEMSQIRNDPGLCVQEKRKEHITSFNHRKVQIVNRKTELDESDGKVVSERIDPSKRCPLHINDFHALNKCRSFRTKPMKERTDILVKHGICFKCCNSAEHFSRKCTENVLCSVCSSNSHPSALHVDDKKPQGGEKKQDTERKNTVNSKCVQICNNSPGGKSCSKTILVHVYPKGNHDNIVKLYAMIDDQSNRSLAKSELFDLLGIHSEKRDFALQTCSGVNNMVSRIARNLIVSSFDESTILSLPPIIECDAIPDNRDEIPTPEIAEQFPHLSEIAHHIPQMDPQAKILLLIGRDLIEAHHVLDQKIGQSAPYAQKLSLGWTIIGETCLNKAHLPTCVTVNKTYLHGNGRPSILLPCERSFTVKESATPIIERDVLSSVFERTNTDDTPGLSQEDRIFLDIMDREFHQNQEGKWIAPLPFKSERRRLPNNYSQAAKRARNLDFSLKGNPIKMEHALTFMQGIFDNGHAQVAPPLQPNDECWYLPIFAIYHPRKPNKVRMVFDSSATYDGISLNSVLLSGPDLTNNLLGILIRFRKERIAVMSDIEQMFYCFGVCEKDQNFLRFLWYKNNDPSEHLIEYKMTVHVFGNTPSPAVATYGLRKAVAEVPDKDIDVKDFVEKNFYVDDALISLPQENLAIDLLERTRQSLMSRGKLRLHKIASNSQEVMNAFSEDDIAKDLKNIDLRLDAAPLQKSLGLAWDLQSDSFKFDVSLQLNPFTKRGMLSTLNSLYDPIGFIAPVILRGKIIFRKVLNSSFDWDDHLPPEYEDEWRTWCESLADLSSVTVPRAYTCSSLQDCSRTEIHVFCDASETAISAVAYLKAFHIDHIDTGFILGKSKLAPTHGHTVPRLELCAAVLGSEIATIVKNNLDSKIDHLQLYSDSRIVLGYLNNTSRRFYTYVSNRVHKILKVTAAENWTYVQSEHNPADTGSRSVSPKDLMNSTWIRGPTKFKTNEDVFERFDLIDPDRDSEVRTKVSSLGAVVVNRSLGIARFERFSSWSVLVRAIGMLRSVILERHGVHCDRLSPNFRQSTEAFLVRTIQQEMLSRERTNLLAGKSVPRDSSVLNLDPYLDDDGILRVGGRLKSANIDSNLKNPCIFPRSHIARLIICHHHEMVHHQGRHYTEGAVRSAGYWIVGGKKLVSSVIYNCVICRKLRGRMESQKMADLPPSRLQPTPPFTYVGVDAFGHWNIVSRKTRGGVSNSKRWAILFTCLTSRASHIEVVEDMSTASFINALRRFLSIRGKVTEFRSDRGTNFIGCTDVLKIDAVNVEDSTVKGFLYNSGCTWIFNPPHSSHMGGVWERIIGLARRILDAILLKEPCRLTHDVLVTLMAEICAILNNRPLVPVSTDPNQPFVLTPNMLLTQKTEREIPPFKELDLKEMYVSHWKQVQVLADQFWKRWHMEYLQLLQGRKKWKESKDNLKVNDVVLLKDKDAHRNDWSMGIISRTFPDADNKVRKIEVRTNRNGQIVHYIRPVTEVVILLRTE